MRTVIIIFLICCTAGCLGYPETIEPVKGFDIQRYLGKWYEIARLDHPFERNLEQVSAEYSLGKDGRVVVKNRGYSVTEKKWKDAVGKAYFVNKPDEGYLKVSFFGPFYGSYVIFELDRSGYEYAFVSGPNTSYLWFLSRRPQVNQELKDRFKTRAKALGHSDEDLIWVNQEL